MIYVTGSFNFPQGFRDDLMRELAEKTMSQEAGNLGLALTAAGLLSLLEQNALPLGLGFSIFTSRRLLPIFKKCHFRFLLAAGATLWLG